MAAPTPQQEFVSACAAGDAPAVLHLLTQEGAQEGAQGAPDPNLPVDAFGSTALIRAADSGALAVVRALVRGATRRVGAWFVGPRWRPRTLQLWSRPLQWLLTPCSRAARSCR